mgnify:CR=1 FL=1
MTRTSTMRRNAIIFAVLACTVSAFTTTTNPFSTTTTALKYSSENNDEAAKLLEKAAALRAEVAAMTGKTVEEVENEARQKKEDARLRTEASRAKREEERANAVPRDEGRYLDVPSTSEDMVYQAARAVERAFKDGINRQTVRFALIREDQYVNGEMNQWPGGAMQMSRESGKPLTKELLKQIRAPTKDADVNELRLPPTVKEQDVLDFDGSALITAEAKAGANGDVQALLFPNTDTKYIKDIDAIDQAMGKRLFLLVNPFWRNLDSWGMNILAPGAKKKAQAVIFDKGYDETYSLLRFSCRGEECVALKCYPYDWQIYAYREDDYAGMDSVIRLGSTKEEPGSAYVTELLNERPEFKDTRNMRQLRKNF